MNDENHKKYVKSISRGSNHQQSIDKNSLSVSLDEQSIQLIKEIKSFMEWDLDTAINSSITYFYKTDEAKNMQGSSIHDLKSRNIKFTPTFKNKQRITKVIKANKLDETYYIVLIHLALKSFSKVLCSKH